MNFTIGFECLSKELHRRYYTMILTSAFVCVLVLSDLELILADDATTVERTEAALSQA